MQRIDPPLTGADERTMLRTWLDYQRATLLLKCEGLSPEHLGLHSIPPSNLSLQGLVRHMTDVERNWFVKVFSGEDGPRLYGPPEYEDRGFDRLDPATVKAEHTAFLAMVDRCRAIEAQAPSLDVDGALHSGDRGPVSLRWIMVHMIEEYARHNGHADLLRECIDGTTGD